MQTEVVWTYLSFIRSRQNHLAKHSAMGKETRQTEKMWEDIIREWTGLEFGKSQKAMENKETVCEIICDAPKNPAVKGKVKVKVITKFYIFIY